MSHPVSAVVFDVGEVLVEWDTRILFRKFIADEAEVEWFASTVITPEWHFQHDAGRDIHEMVDELIGVHPAYADLIRAYAERFNETIPGPVPGSQELVAALDDAGVPLYAITNFGDYVWGRFCPTQPVLQLFRDIVISGFEKISKPDPAIYELAARRFGHAPQAMLFIDDRIANIDSARACGWQVHHFKGAQALEADLRARGLLG